MDESGGGKVACDPTANLTVTMLSDEFSGEKRPSAGAKPLTPSTTLNIEMKALKVGSSTEGCDANPAPHLPVVPSLLERAAAEGASAFHDTGSTESTIGSTKARWKLSDFDIGRALGKGRFGWQLLLHVISSNLRQLGC